MNQIESEKAAGGRLGIWSAPAERQRRPALRVAGFGAARGALAFWSGADGGGLMVASKSTGA